MESSGSLQKFIKPSRTRAEQVIIKSVSWFLDAVDAFEVTVGDAYINTNKRRNERQGFGL